MSIAARVEDMTKECSREIRQSRDARPSPHRFCASFEATCAVQDAPRAATRRSGLLAMTRLASANRLNSCASFLARPL